MDTYILPIKPPHPPLLQIIYNQSPIVQLICTPPFTQQHYHLHNSKPPPPISYAEPPPKIPSLLTNPSLSCIPPTSRHEPYPYPPYPSLQLPYSAVHYHHKSSNLPSPRGLGTSLPSSVSLTHSLIPPQ